MKESRYSSQFIGEVVKNIDPVLTTFFSVNHKLYKFPVHSLREAIYETLRSTMKGCLVKEELMSVMNLMKKSRLKKRTRWNDDYTERLTSFLDGRISKDDARLPQRILLLDEYEIISAVEKEIEDTRAWKARSDSYLIEYPGLHQSTFTGVWNCFKSDLAVCIWKYVLRELNGNINSFYRSYPESFIQSPLFAPSSFNLIMKKTGDNLLEETVYDEDGNPLLALVIPDGGEDTLPKVMDETDLKILNSFISSIDNEFYRSKSTTIDIRALTRAVVGYRPGTSNYKAIADRCMKLVNYNYTVMSEGSSLAFNIFDNIVIIDEGSNEVVLDDVVSVIDESKEYTVIATFGDVLANAIIQKQLIQITEKNYDALQNPMSKIIYYALEKERVSLHGSGHLTCVYSYTYFQKIVRFKVKNRSKNLKLIDEALQDFVDNGICIKEFNRLEDGSYQITFLPLSDEELDDIDLKNPLFITKK